MYLSEMAKEQQKAGDFSGQAEIRKDGHTVEGIEDTATDMAAAKILKGARAEGPSRAGQ